MSIPSLTRKMDRAKALYAPAPPVAVAPPPPAPDAEPVVEEPEEGAGRPPQPRKWGRRGRRG